MRNPDQSCLFTPAPLPIAPLSPSERLACLRLIRSANVGPVAFRELINQFGGAAAALAALPELQRRGGARAPQICPKGRAEAELEAAGQIGAVPLFTIEPGYPTALAAVEAPPPMIYAKGDVSLLQRPALAIVGSRQASAAGIKVARLFASGLADAGLVVVSGLARGIDRAAHEASLAAGTVAVVAGGTDVIYPPENSELHAAIAERGCIVTDMPPGFQPRAKDFPRRNRLISGLALGVLVVEAAHRSGTLVTARFAGEQGREVFAVPGHPLDPRAEGTNQLIKTGATLVTEPGDIIEALEPITGLGSRAFREFPAVVPLPPPDPAGPPEISDGDRSRLMAALGPNPVDVDEIGRATGLGIREVRIALMELDLAGRIVRHGQQMVSLAPDLDAP